MHCQCHFGKVKSMLKCTHRHCHYVTLCDELDRKWWLSYGIRHKHVYSITILYVEIRKLRMHPNTSVGFS